MALQEDLYRQFFKKSLDCIAIYKITPDKKDFVFIDFNPAAESVDRIKKEDLVGRKLTEVFPGIQEFGLLDVLIRVARTGIPEHFPLTFYKDSRISGWRDNYIYKLDDEHVAAFYHDITKQKQYEDQLKLTSIVFKEVQEAIVITDKDTIIMDINQAYESLSGFSRSELIGNKSKFMKSGLHPPGFYKEMWTSLKEDDRWEGEIWDRNKSGTLLTLYLLITTVRNEKNEVTHYIGIYLDITGQKKAQDHIKKLLYDDVLTELRNRNYFIEELKNQIETAARNETKLFLIYLDLDNFKNINDTYGHRTGDKVIMEAARRIHENIRKTDIAARPGGDEYSIIVPNTESEDDAARLSEKLIQVLSEPFITQEGEFHLTASIGIAVFPNDGNDSETLIKNADTAMYNSKNSGKNRYSFFTQKMNQEVRLRIEMENDIRTALQKNEFILYFQPKFLIETGEYHGAEALIRWKHPEKGFIPPDKFIPIAEESDLIVQLGDWVFQEACKFQNNLLRKNIKGSLSINISARQLHLPDIVVKLEDFAVKSGCSCSTIELEITEGILIQDIESSIKTLAALRSRGFTISIDDFGTGYSSMNYLRKLPINILKVDKSFISEIPGNRDDEEIVRAIVAMAKALSLDVIAEGVETKEQADFLEKIGCSLAQGYLYSKPLPPDEFISRFS